MPRPTLNVLSQERLVAELKRYVDTARHAPSGSNTEADAINAVIVLVRENNESALRSHVLHNIGCTRRRWLRQLSTTMPNSAETDIMWRMGCDHA